MNEHQFNYKPSAQETLRTRAEKWLLAAHAGSAPLNIEDLRTALEELEVYRTELEIQNEELRAGRLLLEEAQKKYFRHFDLAPVGLVRLSSRGLALEANILGAAMLGINRRQFHRLRHRHLFLTRVATGSRAAFQQHVEQALASGQMETCELTLCGAKDVETFVRMQSVRSGEESDEPELYVTLTDLTERRCIEQALQESEGRFRSLFENASDLITVLDATGRIRFQSPSVKRVLGYPPEEFEGRNVFDWIHPEDADRAQAALRSRAAPTSNTAPIECRFRHLEDSWVTLQSIGREFPTHDDERLLVVHSRDVTRQKLLEAQLRQSQKMEAIGQLAGGVAHDFNNLLSVIFGHCERLERAFPTKNALSDSVGEILRASKRAAALTRQLLAFSRRQVLAPKVMDLNGVVADAETLLRRLIGEDVRLVTLLQPDLPPVRIDPVQIEQVILNLAVNARGAMPHGGTLTLETSEVERDSTQVEITGGVYILLTVSDTGTGMTPEVQARIFEPFFTTKEPGEGTGLGLSVADGIVKQSGGHIAVDSAPTLGTSFKVYLPAVDEPLATPVQTTPSRSLGGSETVLLVEDEEPVRKITALMLETLGYQVLQAASGEEALFLVEERREKIDLLMTDVVMPGMSGRGLADALAARLPDLKVLFHSGYTADVVVRRGVVQAEMAFLQKPFTPQALARKVRQVLDQPIHRSK